MLKNIIALAIAAAFGSAAFAQAPAASPAKPVESVKPAVIGTTPTTGAPADVATTTKPEIKVNEKKVNAKASSHAEDKKDAAAVEKKPHAKHKVSKKTDATHSSTTPATATPATPATPAASAVTKPEVKVETPAAPVAAPAVKK